MTGENDLNEKRPAGNFLQKKFHAGLAPDESIVLCCVVLCCVVLCCVVFRECTGEKVAVKRDSTLFEIFFVSENMFTPVL